MRRPQVQPLEPAEDKAVRDRLVLIQRDPRIRRPPGVPTGAKAFNRAARDIGIATDAAGRASGIELLIACTDKRYESGRGQPHSKTLRKKQGAEKRASVLEGGCPLPPFGVARTCAIRHYIQFMEYGPPRRKARSSVR